MVNRIIGVVTLISFLLYLGGCTTGQFIPLEEYQKKGKRPPRILAAMMSDSLLYEFRNFPQRVVISDSVLTGKLKNGDFISIPVDSLRLIKVGKLKTTATIVLSAVIVTGLIFIGFLMGSPTVSVDGNL